MLTFPMVILYLLLASTASSVMDPVDYKKVGATACTTGVQRNGPTAGYDSDSDLAACALHAAHNGEIK